MSNFEFDTVGHLADVLKEEQQYPSPSLRRRQGVIAAVHGTGADIYLGGSSLLLTNVAWMPPYRPTKGDTVWVDINGSDFIIVGAAAPTLGTTSTPVNATLLNSWTNFNAGWQVARYYITADGWVHLDGLVARASTSNLAIFNLPVGFRPVRNERAVVVCGGSVDQAEIAITPAGDVFLSAISATGATGFVSLNGICFQTAGAFDWGQWKPCKRANSAWIPSLGFEPYSAVSPMMYIRDDGWVKAAGVLQGGGGGQVALLLPDGAEPLMNLTFCVTNYNGTNAVPARFDVIPGEITAVIVTATNLVSIDPIRYWNRYSEVGWINVGAMSNSWVNYQSGNYPDAQYRKDKFGIVHFRGLIKNGTLNTTVFTLPAGYRPAVGQLFTADSNGAVGRVDVHADGTVNVVGNSNVYFDLSQVMFLAEQ